MIIVYPNTDAETPKGIKDAHYIKLHSRIEIGMNPNGQEPKLSIVLGNPDVTHIGECTLAELKAAVLALEEAALKGDGR